ncbi:type II toxin-antitoxin system VapC family toxin [Infirmifilum lucidum]|uniref:Ribonuclease VapC n=1 Tax=Infirmifilum lucidum TaxID=2776706 RepID=A0A7L9FG09_9CREN|nr:type II toxin-antitoxin system VapC family toxin [Infirmifilum lucidum]QOJ78551.1 type II toxin-antitoxin system VapC family toxin [Infirmifilum lucidum]
MSELYLFDASAIINLLKRGSVRTLARGATINLVVYEALNAVWKEHALLGNIDGETARRLVEVLAEVFEAMDVRSIHGLEEKVFENAVKLRLTVYDSSYVTYAAENGLTLVSDDEKLLERVRDVVNVKRSVEVLRETVAR